MDSLVAAGYFTVLNNSTVMLTIGKIFLLSVQFLTHLCLQSPSFLWGRVTQEQLHKGAGLQSPIYLSRED